MLQEISMWEALLGKCIHASLIPGCNAERPNSFRMPETVQNPSISLLTYLYKHLQTKREFYVGFYSIEESACIVMYENLCIKMYESILIMGI